MPVCPSLGGVLGGLLGPYWTARCSSSHLHSRQPFEQHSDEPTPPLGTIKSTLMKGWVSPRVASHGAPTIRKKSAGGWLLDSLPPSSSGCIMPDTFRRHAASSHAMLACRSIEGYRSHLPLRPPIPLSLLHPPISASRQLAPLPEPRIALQAVAGRQVGKDTPARHVISTAAPLRPRARLVPSACYATGWPRQASHLAPPMHSPLFLS